VDTKQADVAEHAKHLTLIQRDREEGPYGISIKDKVLIAWP
jgi:hypothetical protein